MQMGKHCKSIVFFVVVVFYSQHAESYGPSGHGPITSAAYRALPDSLAKIIEPYSNDLIRKYCMYPDIHRSPEAQPYNIYITDRHFHYMPTGDDVRNIRDFVITGFTEYMENIQHAFNDDKKEEGTKFLGSLFHVLQDSSQPGCHSLEGPYGMGMWQLNEILAPSCGSHPQFSPNAAAQILAADNPENTPGFKIDISGYAPKFLGTSADEIAFHLFESYLKTVRLARRNAYMAALEFRAGNTDNALMIWSEAPKSSAKNCADIAYTLLKKHFGDIEEDDITNIKETDLTEIEPASRPGLASRPYRFTPMVHHVSLGKDRKIHPLELWITDEHGKKEKRVFEKGFSMGMSNGPSRHMKLGYDIPKNVFSRLEVVAGIHAVLGANPLPLAPPSTTQGEPDAKMKMSIRLDGKDSWVSGEIVKDTPADVVSVSIIEGGRLEFIVEDLNERRWPWSNHANQPVWANPVLIRAE